MTRVPLALLSMSLTLGCTPSEEPPTDTGLPTDSHTAADTAAETDPADTTPTGDPDTTPYTDGRTATTADGLYVVALTIDGGATPGTHDASLVITKDGLPAATQMVALSAWMPAHGHGTDPVAVTESTTPGTYDAPGLNFKMPGQWDVTVVVGEAGPGDAVFRLDVASP